MKTISNFILSVFAFLFLTSESSCNDSPVSRSGVNQATTTVQTDPKGNTIEQNNIIGRLREDNKPGSIKHLYIISAYSGQVILYSTVRGKVTSSGKRLSPSMLSAGSTDGFKIDMGNGDSHYTNEVLADDGAYGSSVDYIFWWDSKGIYHQHYPSGGQIIHISNEPIAVKSITLNLELNSQQ